MPNMDTGGYTECTLGFSLKLSNQLKKEAIDLNVIVKVQALI